MIDALRPLGIHHLDFPYSPAAIWTSDRQGEKTMMKEASITVRDGTEIGVAIYAPEGSGRFPVTLLAASLLPLRQQRASRQRNVIVQDLVDTLYSTTGCRVGCAAAWRKQACIHL